MTLALVARCDNGGLGSMTWEAWRHLAPARTLVVRANGPGCGTPDPSRYEERPVRVCRNPTDADAAWLLEGATIVYTAETWYGNTIPRAARLRRVRTALHVMPEYWTPQVAADLLLAPTPWQAPRGSQLVPVPVARDRFERRKIDCVEVLYHVVSPTNDRNGTRLLLASLEELRHPCRVLIRRPGPDRAPPRRERIGRAHVEWLPHHNGPYFEAWPTDAQALVLPRRFAGLSLPMQEAAALGLPIITLDRQPEAAWLPPEARVEAKVTGNVRTWRACQVPHWDASASALADRIDALTTDPDLADLLADHANAWADTLDWPRWIDTYRAILR